MYFYLLMNKDFIIIIIIIIIIITRKVKKWMNPQSTPVAGYRNQLKSRFESEIRTKIFSKPAGRSVGLFTPSISPPTKPFPNFCS